MIPLPHSSHFSTIAKEAMQALQFVRNQSQLYRELSKSGIVALVLISVLGGYLIGQPFEVPLSFFRLAMTLFGVLFLASGSSALNQYQERHIDAEMPRTAKRPLPSGRMTPRGVLIFVFVTLFLGLGILAWVSLEVLALGITAVVFYNGLYTIWWKRRWAYAAVPGAIPGALPILMGHVAACHNLFQPGGIYLFFILFYWQMPHFWVLALRFEKDYRMGGFPTLPVARGTSVTVSRILVWCLAYVALALIAPFFLKTRFIYMAIALAVSFKVLWELRSFVRAPDQSKAWLRFFLWINFSLIFYIAAAAADLWSIYLP
jgi:protoheme IX farnesyltransferase